MSDERELWSIEHGTEPVLGAQLEGPVWLENVHPATQCSGEFCVLHNPSDHHMREWPLNWRDDRSIMERICPHGIGHPDPDDLAHLERVGRTGEGVHGCDGCCHEE